LLKITVFWVGIVGMTARGTFENAQKLLKKHNQSHLLAFWGRLDESQRKSLLSQIRELDLVKIDGWVEKLVKKAPSGPIRGDLRPAVSYRRDPADSEQKKAIDFGKELIRKGKVAAFVVAGGQGTRLGFDGPKGNFPISPVKEKTFFQIFAETITAVSAKYGNACPWYIMTSSLNHTETMEIFRSNGYYGLTEKDVFIFEQGTLPNFSFDGKILLADKANIGCSPDGHGGSIKALQFSGALEDMKRRGVKYISYWQVDNPLVSIFDPLFIGLHALNEAEMSSKAVIKTDPMEKVGNFCLEGGMLTVIEYTEFNELLDSAGELQAKKRNPDGSLVFQLGSIAIHIISVDFVDKLNTEGFSLPLHRAKKKIPHIDEHGNHLVPDKESGIKLESFIFDALPKTSKSIILETPRSEEFAPTKNTTGVDSAETAREMMIARAVSWLESAGVIIPRKANGSADCVIEIAPGFALDKEDIKAKLNQIPEIKPGDELYLG
jgi:UDP-N-acetylglucosamine/UDP-N-acetylgalactosamine diphosphorylase